MQERLPLTEVSGDEVLARVVYQLIVHYYHEYPDSFDNPTEALLNLAHSWYTSDITLIAEQLQLVALWVANGGTVATWLRARIFTTTGRATILARPGRARRR